MDFSNLKSLTIPEGEVVGISIGGVVVWQASGEVVPPEQPEETEIIQGKYYFNEFVTNDIRIDENVPFTCNGKEYTGIIITSTDIYYKTSVGSDWVATLTDDKFTFFQDVYRTIVFSTASVSLTLYNWIQANTSVPVQETVPVSGTWYFNETPTEKDLTESVNFTSNGSSYTKIDLYHFVSETQTIFLIRFMGKVGSSSTDARDEAYRYSSLDSDTPYWINEAYRTIEFVGVQYVSREFYEWLVENAEQQGVAVSGSWEFDKILILPSQEILQNNATFYITYNGYYQMQNRISVQPTEIKVGYGSTFDATIYKAILGWVYTESRIITFDGTQTVSKEFYDWFIANATKLDKKITTQ